MKKPALLFTLLSLFVLNSKAQQKQLFLNASVLSQPDEFHFPLPQPNESKSLGFEFNLGYNSHIKESNFIWEGQLSFLNATAESFIDEFIPPAGGSGNDPQIPDKATFKYISNLLGLKAGIGYRIGNNTGKHSFIIITGASGYLPFLSKVKTKLDDNDWKKQTMYNASNFQNGILYGFYLKPTYQLAFSKNSPWALNIFGEANLLWRNATDYGNPLFMAGGGIAVSYSLK